MTNAGMIAAGIIIVIVVAGAAYYIATLPPATTTSTTVATTVAPTTTVSSSGTLAVLSAYSSKSALVNASKGAILTVTAEDGVNITVTIPPGTFVLVSNQTLPVYNFTLATFALKSNIGSPAGYSNQTPAYGFAFEVNGQITPNISFVNSSKVAVPLTTVTHYPSTWGSWIFLGGTFNASTGTYTGGKYVAQNTWEYNATSGTMTNTQFFKPVLWIFTIGPARTSTVSSTTTAAQTSASSSSTSTATTTTSGGYG